MSAVAVFEALRDVYHNDEALEQSLGKLLQFKLEDERRRLAEYERDLRAFEEQYEMTSSTGQVPSRFIEAVGRSDSKVTAPRSPVTSVSLSKKTKGSPSGMTFSPSILLPWG